MPPSPGAAGPSANAIRVIIMAEIVAAANFERDRLYVEWQLQYPEQLWRLQSPDPGDHDGPGLLKVRDDSHCLAHWTMGPGRGD